MRQMIAALVCEDSKAGYKARSMVKVDYEDKEGGAVFDLRDVRYWIHTRKRVK